jgi:hypothetical protein
MRSNAPRLILTLVLLFQLDWLGDSKWVKSTEAASFSASSSLNAAKATLIERTSAMTKYLLDGESPVHLRDLQSSTTSTSPTYWVNYTAQFQVVQDTGCTAPSPVIRVYCVGTDIQVHATSDPSIVCSTTRQANEFALSYLECTNACGSATPCNEIYLNVDQGIASGPFGTIDFSCSGSTLDQVNGAMQMVEPTVKPSCAASASSTVTRVLNVARLGVSCPPLNDEGEIAIGSSAASITRSAVYDDYYFECVPSTASFPLSDTDNSYTCFDGLDCTGAACNVNLTSLYVEAEVSNFQDTCVQTTLPDPIPAATFAPTSASATIYTARFEAAWSLQFTPRSYDASCQGKVPTVVIACQNGNIRFTRSAYDAMNCTATEADVLICFADAGVGINSFVSITYVSAIAEK